MSSPLATRDIQNGQNTAHGNDTREPKLSINKHELSKNTLASTAGASSSSITHSKAEAATASRVFMRVGFGLQNGQGCVINCQVFR
ncbi:hypothetical protein CEXT_65511 [Caerostris extrusa]|uniref:Uncharacterized protein n=1 Tax=Caerostris extrusa TaxID=172846 RepID=A0AAV4V2X2_CAEEX|nr:hypothetical protein CEXT_65511 [Caerostris extrusa]